MYDDEPIALSADDEYDDLAPNGVGLVAATARRTDFYDQRDAFAKDQGVCPNGHPCNLVAIGWGLLRRWCRKECTYVGMPLIDDLTYRPASDPDLSAWIQDAQAQQEA